MSNGEVKRWWLRQSSARRWNILDVTARKEYSRDGDIEVMPVEDHERIVAGLKEELEVFRNREYGFENELELKQTIASQKRVIEKLKQAHEKNANEDFRGNRSTESIRSFKVLKEVEAIEKGEA